MKIGLKKFLVSLKSIKVIKKFKNSLPNILKNQFLRNVLKLTSGSALAQIITILSAPVITRLYGSEAFGVLGVFLALISVIAPVAGLTYPIAIILPKKDTAAKSLVKLSIFIGFIVSLAFFFIFKIGGESLLNIIGAKKILDFIVLIPVAIFFAVCVETSRQWLFRKKQFTSIAKIDVVKSIFTNGTKIIFGWINPIGLILIVIYTIGNFLHAIMLFGKAKPSLGNIPLSKNKYKNTSLISLMKHHSDFPLYRAPQVFINNISQNIPILLLSSFLGPASAGFYTLNKTVLRMPSMILGKSVRDIFYPKVTEAVNQGKNITNTLIKSTLGLIAIAIVPFGLVVFFGPSLFVFIFGEEWIIAGKYASWLSIMFFFNFINKPCVAAVPVLGLQKGLVIYEIISTGSKILALFIGLKFLKDDVISVALFAITGSVAYFFLIIWIIRASKLKTLWKKNK